MSSFLYCCSFYWEGGKEVFFFLPPFPFSIFPFSPSLQEKKKKKELSQCLVIMSAFYVLVCLGLYDS